MELKNKNKNKNKKADERLLSLYLFIIYIIVTIGIVSGVILFYGSSLDVREFEARILNDQVINCISNQGSLKMEINSSFDIKSECNFDFQDGKEYGVKIENLDSGEIAQIGNKDFFELCNLNGKKLPKCFQREIYILNKDNGVFFRITTVINKISKNVK